MVAYKRITEEKHSEKPEYWEQGQQIITGSEQQSATPLCTDTAQTNQPGYCC
jgi:hypothetical protein